MNDPICSQVSFDPKTGLITVHGDFSMSVTYVWLGSSESGHSLTNVYDGKLFWDGKALQLITIDGSVS